jgi:beta-lactamase class A
MRPVGLAMLFATTALPAAAQAPSLEPLAATIRRLADSSGASVGVGIRHVESGQEWYLNGDRPFLMGSTFKIAVAVQLLTLVDHGRERLDRLVPLLPGDIFPSGSLLSERFGTGPDPGVQLAIRRYLELMLILSDNSATDVILRHAGGTAAVMERVRALGIVGMRVDRTVMEIYRDYVGLDSLPPLERRNLGTFVALMRQLTPEQVAAAQRAYHASEKDRSTPRAMVDLLTKIWRREAISPGNTEELLAIMRREETGRDRIRRWLPAGTPVANKTGSYGTVVANDVGIIDLPDGAGHLVVAVFTEDQAASDAAKERLIADITNAAYRHFTSRPR